MTASLADGLVELLGFQGVGSRIGARRDGALVGRSASFDGLVGLWDGDYWAKVENMRFHRTSVQPARFRSCGREIVSAALDGFVVRASESVNPHAVWHRRFQLQLGFWISPAEHVIPTPH
jgi:hypothetical protein